MTAHLADGAARAFGDGADFAFAGCEKREDTISFPKVGTLEDNGFGGITMRRAHEEHLAYMKKDATGKNRVGLEATSGFEPLVQLLQSRALPLGDVALSGNKKMERETGIEPATFSLARRCSTTEPLP